MKIQIVKAEQQTTTTWAGGTTTELFIYPENTTFANRDFDFRISTATVEVEESTFTIFKQLNRILMILEGELEINHIDRYTKKLQRFDIDEFHGEWPTTAKGKVTDFNLIFNDSVKGSVEAIQVSNTCELEIQSSFSPDYTAIYVIEGKIEVNHSTTLTPKDCIIFSDLNTTDKIIAKALEDAILVAVNVKLK